ncbi:MAG: nuclear transport factor 2 family protein [Microthrixaceae bacterium]|nr:nuclear transport factor 2 family protein [Microthrixaceae bacterium]MCO5311734.1 nuclear transport factor 2 family protein [Microthrixaceae bacterium]HPB44941.1 nuclear transport factor 2 family protein [Microthrixaceae bacterium]
MDTAAMKQAVEAYTRLHSARDLDALVDLFAEDAVAYDPVDADPHVGKAAIREFFSGTHQMADEFKLELTGPVRAVADFAAFPMTVTTKIGEMSMQLDIIDVFTFNDAGKVVEMKAYWSMDDARFG